MIRYFNISAISIPIVYNKYGDVDPDGLMYILSENETLAKTQVALCPGTYVDLVQPLVIRANEEDIVEINFTNELCFATSINVKGLPNEVQNSDGAFVGFNASSLAQPCESITYRWHCTTQGVFFFSDLGNPLSSELGSNIHGLFGAIVVEAPGSSWTHPQTGAPISSGVFADIHHPFLPSHREFVTLFHDEAPVKNRFLEPPIDPMTGMPSMTHAINYRAEPMRNKLYLIEQGIVCPYCEGEEVHHDSWVFGDPPPTVLPRCYRGDPVRWYAVGAGMKETHIFHLHLQQWLTEQKDLGSNIIDSLALGPGQSIQFDILYGAGSLQRAYGDVIYHCHLYPHFDEGMWGIQRIHDVFEDGSRLYPDGSPIPPLMPLPDRPCPPMPTPERPGFPLFIPGTVGCRSPVPPIGWDRNFPITPLETNALDPRWREGSLFVNPCPPHCKKRIYHVVALQLPLIYNEGNWHDPEGRIYALAEDEKAILSGKKRPEPLFIHALPNECIEIHFKNKLPTQLGPNAFQMMVHTLFESCHVHLVKFDVLSSDGANTGWNYFTGAAYEQEVIFRWYADVELRTCFFHDHLFANSNQLHGLFAGLVIEPEGSVFINSHTSNYQSHGSQLAIQNPILPDFREFCLAVHDWIPAYDGNNEPLNPPEIPGSMEDFGIMAFNYASAPFAIRGGDPAYVLSSYMHGDPWTPLLEGYVGDPVRVRLIDGAHEESHAINFNRYSWLKNPTTPSSPYTQTQHIGISESFTFQFSLQGCPYHPNKENFDVLYYSGGMDDFWLGTWGILRVHATMSRKLYKLKDRPYLPRHQATPKICYSYPPKSKPSPTPYLACTPIHRYHVAAIQLPIIYNKWGDRDPYGMIFVPYDEVNTVLSGQKNPEPLIITANAGEAVEITLTNLMPPYLDVPAFPQVPVQRPWPYSPRVSLHAQFAEYDVLSSDGATVGFNPDQTVGVGESITYQWFFPKHTSEALLFDFGDVMNHRKHGLFGSISFLPPGSIPFNSFTGALQTLGDQLTIRNIFLPDYRQFVLLAHNGIYLQNKDGVLLPRFYFNPDLTPTSAEFDTEDQGMKGFNLKSEPFYNRLVANGGNVSELFVSNPTQLGDPATPVLYAQVNDSINLKVLVPADKPRATSFFLHGHLYYSQPQNLLSQIIGANAALTIGNSSSKNMLNGATNGIGHAGDYMYQSCNITWDIEEGMWGIMRVLDSNDSSIIPLDNRNNNK